jgi:hypothetical protein
VSVLCHSYAAAYSVWCLAACGTGGCATVVGVMFELASPDEPLDETTENTLKFLDTIWAVMPPNEGVSHRLFAVHVQGCNRSSSSMCAIKHCIQWHVLALLLCNRPWSRTGCAPVLLMLYLYAAVWKLCRSQPSSPQAKHLTSTTFCRVTGVTSLTKGLSQHHPAQVGWLGVLCCAAHM